MYPWSTQAAGPAANESLSCQVGPPWMSKTVGQRARRPGRPLHEGVDTAAGARHPLVLDGHRRRGLHTGRVEDDLAGRRADHRRLGGRRPQELHAAVRAGRRSRHRALRRRAPAPGRGSPGRTATARCAPRSCSPPAARNRPDTTRRSGRRPGGRAPGPSPRRTPRPTPSAPSGRAADARRAAGCPRRPGRSRAPPGRARRAALGVVELRDRRAVHPQHPHRRVHRVTVLGVLDRDQRSVVREIADARRLAVPVDLDGVLAGPADIDRRAVLVRRPADDRRPPVPAEREPRRDRRGRAREPRARRARRPRRPPPRERLAPPDPELVAVLVVEPPDPLAVRRQRRRPSSRWAGP